MTYAEVLTGALLGHHDEDQVRGFLAQMISEVLPVDVTLVDKKVKNQTTVSSKHEVTIPAGADRGVPGVEIGASSSFCFRSHARLSRKPR